MLYFFVNLQKPANLTFCRFLQNSPLVALIELWLSIMYLDSAFCTEEESFSAGIRDFFFSLTVYIFMMRGFSSFSSSQHVYNSNCQCLCQYKKSSCVYKLIIFDETHINSVITPNISKNFECARHFSIVEWNLPDTYFNLIWECWIKICLLAKISLCLILLLLNSKWPMNFYRKCMVLQ